MSYALEILEYERLRLRRHIRKVEENISEIMCNIPHEEEKQQLAETEEAIGVLLRAEPKEATTNA